MAHNAEHHDATESPIVVLACRTCGDVFPSTAGPRIECPSCGSTDSDVAGEPLL